MKFVIVSPRQSAGGPIVLHALCKYLNELGHDAKVFYNEAWVYKQKTKYKYWFKWIERTLQDSIRLFRAKILKQKSNGLNGYIDESVRGCPRKYLPFIDDDTVVIYPDVMYGNPLRAKKVVRWFLYHNRFDDSAYDKSDLFVCYREVFNDWRLNPNGITLHTPYFDLDKYKQYNFGERKGNCYIVRKGSNRTDLPKKFDGIVIDNLLEEEKVKVFNECEYCISYDTQTAYSSIAALCGCISVIVPEEGKRKSDYRSVNEVGYGVAWGFSENEKDFAKATRCKVLELYKLTNDKGINSAGDFIKKCSSYFK